MKNLQKGSVAVVSSVIILLILLIGVSWMYFKQPAPVNKVSNNSTAQNDETSDLYKNLQYGYSIEHPITAQLNTVDPKKVVILPKDTKGSISIEIVQPSEACSTSSGVDPSSKTINGVKFSVYNLDRIVSGQMVTEGSNGSATARLYCTTRNGNGYRLITKLPYVGTPIQVESDTVLNQILESFKFN